MRTGGLALVTIVFLGALARMWSPQAPTPAGAQPSTVPATREKGIAQESPRPVAPKSTEPRYILALSEKIRDFFGQEPPPPCALPNLDHWCVPQEEWANIRFVIATVPDPVHTHLSLFFDRSIDAIQQGATSEGYTFDRAVMPWHYLDDPSSEETQDQAKLRESFPGLMIFRGEANSPNPPLFVFIVGETPTSGINEEQFEHALEIVQDIRKGAPIPLTAPEFGILGPTFSGSLYSLGAILTSYLRDSKNTAAYSGGRTLPVYATVMGTASIESFQEQTQRHLPQIRMVIFQEDATEILTALHDFVSNDLRYKDADIAVLNEDETAYGRLLTLPDFLTLSFPRGISQFRSAYSKEFQSNSAQNDSANGNQQTQRNLRLDLGVTGSDDDSIAPYAKAQTPLSQEGVMLAILSELHLREPKFILLRATDPLDELFLARYLRDKYPQGRLVVPSPDLLFPRDEGGQLDSVLGLNTYPLSPARMNQNLGQSCGRSIGSDASPLVFPASSGAALYNATSMLVKRLTNIASTQQTGSPSQIQPPTGLPKTGATVTSDRNVTVEPEPPDPPCSISPNLWLTVLSRNSIHPIKVLPAHGSAYFPASSNPWSLEREQRDTRMPLTWFFTYVLCLFFLGLHYCRSRTGGTLGQWQTPKQREPVENLIQRKAFILWLGGIVIVGIYVVLASINTPARVGAHYYRSIPLTAFLWTPLAAFACWTSWDFDQRREEPLLCRLFLVFTLLASGVGIVYALRTQRVMVLWQQRALDITSGVSPATPLLLLLLGLYICFGYSLRAKSLVDWRCPQLPDEKQLPERYYRLTDPVKRILRVIQPFSGPWWVADVPALVIVGCLALMSLSIAPGYVPLRSLEGLPFDSVYSIILGCSLVILIATLLRTIALWRAFRLMLAGLDRAGLRDALHRLSGFEWTVIWNPAWSVEKEGYKLFAREIQIIERLEQSLGEEPDKSKADANQPLRDRITETLALRDQLVELVRGLVESPTRPLNVTSFADLFRQIQGKFAQTAGLLCKDYLDESWKHLASEDGSAGSEAKKSESPGTEINVGTALIKVGTAGEADPAPLDPSGLSHNSLRLAEEFYACVYANFLVTVLLRIRGLVFSAVVMYVCFTFSMISYPFQPAPELSTLAIVLFLFSGAVIGYVYEEMHREPTLSRMTSTDPGKLGSAFWTKFITAGIAPLVALASTVYPPFGHFLYTLVGPLLQALR
jgi:hypothetical protein